MLFIICLIVSIISCFLVYWFDYNDHDYSSFISTIIAFPTTAAAIIMIIVLLITYVGVPKTEAKWQECYASLNTRIEEHMYYPWDRAELIEEVQKWNEDFSAQEKAQKNIWIAIFNPESIEGLDKIDLKRIK